MSDEKIKILEMIQNGKITAAEGLELLQALDDSFIQQNGGTNTGSRFSAYSRYQWPKQKSKCQYPLKFVKKSLPNLQASA